MGAFEWTDEMKSAAIKDASRVVELHHALSKLRSACQRYDDDPYSDLSKAVYAEALSLADDALSRSKP